MSFGSVLKISSKESLAAVELFPYSIDAVLSRFSPIPLDTRSLAKGLAVSTPYLDAQVNIPLLLLAFMIGAGYSRGCGENGSVARLHSGRAGTILLWTSVALFAVATVASLSAKVYGYAPGLRIIQFPYRMVTYQNLALLAATFAQLLRIRWDTSTSQWCVALTACLTLAATGVVVNSHVFAIMEMVNKRMPNNVDPADPSDTENATNVLRSVRLHTEHSYAHAGSAEHGSRVFQNRQGQVLWRGAEDVGDGRRANLGDDERRALALERNFD